MKRQIFIFLMIFTGLSFFGQTPNFTISGTVEDIDSGEPIPGQMIMLQTDSIAGDFFYFNIVETDSNGYYEDSFFVADAEGWLFVSTPGCEGYMLTDTAWYAENETAEVNFQTCSDPAGGDCQAMFYYYPEANDWLTINFNDASYGFPTNWDWDFGDGNTSAEQNPVHTFADFGEYLVTLTISDDSLDCSSSIEMPVIVGDSTWLPDSCMAWFMARPDTADFMTMLFLDMSIGMYNEPPTSWSWEFGDGSTSDEQNPVHTYAQEDEYEVCLTVTFGDVCESTYCEMIEVIDWDSYCQALFYYYPIFDSLPNEGTLDIQFMDYSYGNPTSWDWDFGDGNSSTEQNPIHAYEESGIYDVCLTIANPEDTCESTLCQEIYVFNDTIFDCFAWFDYEIEELTVDFIGYLENSQSGIYTWEFGDGNSGSGQTVSHTYDEDGIYMVTMTVEDSLSDCYTTHTDMLWVGDDFSFDVSGYVYLGDSIFADYAYVYLMTFDTINDDLISIADTEIDENGYYEFAGVGTEHCVYFVQAELTDASAWFGDYVPTYHFSALNWVDAWPIFPFPSGYMYNVYMIENETNSMGDGMIAGVVNTEESRSALSDVQILLLDESNNPLTYRRTDENGDFDFSDLAFGTYIVYTEIVGIQTTPVTITLSAENPDANVNIVVINGEALLGIEEPTSAFIAQVSAIFPNPVTHKAAVVIDMKQDSRVQLSVYNSIGHQVLEQESQLNAGSNRVDFDFSALPKGIYFMSIQPEDGIKTVKKLVKL